MTLRTELLNWKKKGYKIYEFGTRLMWERPHTGVESPFVSKHLTNAEYKQVKDLIDGIHTKRPKGGYDGN
jgi:hypothetical protein